MILIWELRHRDGTYITELHEVTKRVSPDGKEA